jgi:CheY-like chemotaxis protein
MDKSRVLVVDDDQWLRPLLGTWLAEEGYDVLEAGSGTEALEQVRDRHPDLVVLDANLPRRSGLDVLEDLAGNGPTRDLPVILMSGSVDLAESAQAPLADAALQKPLDLEELLAHIARSLATHHATGGRGHCPRCQCRTID